jgi:hypothetical protein
LNALLTANALEFKKLEKTGEFGWAIQAAYLSTSPTLCTENYLHTTHGIIDLADLLTSQ